MCLERATAHPALVLVTMDAGEAATARAEALELAALCGADGLAADVAAR